MNKHRILLGIALMLLFAGIAFATASATSDVIIYAFDQNPAGSDEGNEWVTFHNPSNESVDIGNWTFESTHGTTAIDWIAEGTTLYPGAYCTYTPNYGWLDNSEEAIIYGIQRVRLVGVNAPEIGEAGYEEAKEFVNKTCWGEAIKLDVDDMKQFDPYYRILAVVYVNDTNLNEKMVREGYAEVMYIPPSEFDSREWKVDYTPSPSQMPTTTPIPGFELLFAIIGVVVAVCLVRKRGHVY
jgi:micrococcal nuclease